MFFLSKLSTADFPASLTCLSSLDWDGQKRCGLCSPGRLGEPGEKQHLDPLKHPLARQVRVVHIEPPAAMLHGNVGSIRRVPARMYFQEDRKSTRLNSSHITS